MRATEQDIITRNGGTIRIPDDSMVSEAKTLSGICARHPHLMPIYVDYATHMQHGDMPMARIAKAFILSYQNI